MASLGHNELTHSLTCWCYIASDNLVIIGPDNGALPIRHNIIILAKNFAIVNLDPQEHISIKLYYKLIHFHLGFFQLSSANAMVSMC